MECESHAAGKFTFWLCVDSEPVHVQSWQKGFVCSQRDLGSGEGDVAAVSSGGVCMTVAVRVKGNAGQLLFVSCGRTNIISWYCNSCVGKQRPTTAYSIRALTR
jgi:hypothetical protein